MTWYKRIKGFYDKGYWTKSMVGEGVICNKITVEEYENITGEVFENPEE